MKDKSLSRFFCIIFLMVYAGVVLGDVAWRVIVPEESKLGDFTHLKYPSWGERTHFGVDILAKCGEKINPLAEGTVVAVKHDHYALGNALMMRHEKLAGNGEDLFTIYLHMIEPPTLERGGEAGKILAPGDKIFADDVIGRVGDTGSGSGCHVHFEMRKFYKPEVAGDGWYHEETLNIYADGDVSNEDWARDAGGYGDMEMRILVRRAQCIRRTKVDRRRLSLL